MSLIGILFIIFCFIFGTGLILSAAGFFYFRNKWKKRKKLREEKMAAKLYEKLINEEDEKLRSEIEDTIFNYNAKNSATPNVKKISNEQNTSDDLYKKCVSFIQKMSKSANYFLDNSEVSNSKIKEFIETLDDNDSFKLNAKYKVDFFSDKVFDFLSKNKKNIDKIEKMKDIWKS